MLGCVAALLPAPAVAGPAVPFDVTTADLSELRQRLEQVTRKAELAATEVEQAAARAAQLRIAMDSLAEERDHAVAALGDRVRQIYMRPRPDPLTQVLAGIAAPDLMFVQRGYEAAVRTDEELIEAVTAESAYARSLKRSVDRLRAELLRKARPVFDAQEEAHRLLADAELRFAADQAALALLAQQRGRLAAASSRVAYAVAPAVTARGRRAQAAEEPIIRLLESSGPGIPPGYRRTGVTVRGIASWYGPGFVGNPTASGSPYDPERLTAAMLPPVKLGTVVHVTTSDGLSINVLVNDRGPYGKGRVIDLSRAGSRLLGFDGLKQVTVELLEPVAAGDTS